MGVSQMNALLEYRYYIINAASIGCSVCRLNITCIFSLHTPHRFVHTCLAMPFSRWRITNWLKLLSVQMQILPKDVRNKVTCIWRDISEFLYTIQSFLTCSRTLNGYLEPQDIVCALYYIYEDLQWKLLLLLFNGSLSEWFGAYTIV